MSFKYASLSGLGVARGTRSSQRSPYFGFRLTPVQTEIVGTAFGQFANPFSTPATPHTLSAWSALVLSSTPTDVHYVSVAAPNLAAASTNSATLIDIGIGASGSEVVIASGIPFGGSGGGINFGLPLFIPAGSRVSVRAQSARTNFSMAGLAVRMYATPFGATTPTAIDVLGISRANSGATPMSGSAGTYIQIVASTAKDYQSVICLPSLAAGTTSNSGGNGVFTTAIGPAGSERDVYETRFGFNSSNNSTFEPSSMSYIGGGIHVPAGSRIAVKHNLASSPGVIAAAIVGVPYV